LFLPIDIQIANSALLLIFNIIIIIIKIITVAGIFGSFPKNHCDTKAICESFRDSYLLAIFI